MGWFQLSQGTVILIVLLFWAIFFVAIQSARMRKKQDMINQRFLEKEDEANSARKRPLDEELFFTADLSFLPSLPEGDPYRVERTAKRKMIRFLEPVSNAALKTRYGRTQLEQLAQYEENFNEYLRALTNWAGALAKAENDRDALCILNHAIALGSEFRNTYKFAADIHARAEDTKQLEELLERVNARDFRDPVMVRNVVAYINDKLDTILPGAAIPG